MRSGARAGSKKASAGRLKAGPAVEKARPSARAPRVPGGVFRIVIKKRYRESCRWLLLDLTNPKAPRVVSEMEEAAVLLKLPAGRSASETETALQSLPPAEHATARATSIADGEPGLVVSVDVAFEPVSGRWYGVADDGMDGRDSHGYELEAQPWTGGSAFELARKIARKVARDISM